MYVAQYFEFVCVSALETSEKVLISSSIASTEARKGGDIVHKAQVGMYMTCSICI